MGWQLCDLILQHMTFRDSFLYDTGSTAVFSHRRGGGLNKEQLMIFEDSSSGEGLSGIASCDSDTDSNCAMRTARETSKTKTLRNKVQLIFPLLRLVVGNQS